MNKRTSAEFRPDHQLFIRVVILGLTFLVVLLAFFFIMAIQDKNQRARLSASASGTPAVPAESNAKNSHTTDLLVPSPAFSATNSLLP